MPGGKSKVSRKVLSKYSSRLILLPTVGYLLLNLHCFPLAVTGTYPSASTPVRDQSLLRGGGGLVKLGGGSMIFMQGKSGGHINLCTHIRELCYTKGGKGVRISKKCASKRGGTREFEHGPPSFAPALPPL